MPLAEALAEMGHELTLLALHHDYAHAAERQFTRNGVRVRYVGQMHVLKRGNAKSYYPTWKLAWITAVATLRLTLAALTTPADAIHVCKTQPMNGLAAWFVHLLRRTPVYLDSDDYEAANNRFGGRWQQRIVAGFEDWLPSFAAGITVNTRFIAERFLAAGYPPERLFLVPNGAAQARFAVLEQPGAEERIAQLRQEVGVRDVGKTAVYIGSLSLVSHAVDLLLEAFALVCQELPQAQLFLAGGGEDWAALKQLAESLGIGQNVVFLGRVPAEEIAYYYRLGCVSVDPRRDTIQVRSSLSLKLIESIVAGVPCITTDIGDMREFAQGVGLTTPPDDAPALADALKQLFNNPALVNTLSQEATRQRDSHWWSARAQIFAQVYRA
jgi:glycosyltransferase involved in cell wall biosynthesis